MADAERTLRELINKIVAEQEYKDYEIILNEILTGGANYTSKLYTVTIKEPNKDDLHLFAKVSVMGEKFRSEMPTNMFDIERIVYTKLAKTYQSLEEENEVPDEHRLKFTKLYGCNPTSYQETLVLENLIEAGYQNYDRFKSIDWEYASSAVREMAKLHALSMAYRDKYPEELKNYLEMFNVNMQDPEPLVAMAEGSKALALKAVKPEHKESLKKFFEEEMKDMFSSFLDTPERLILIHGDFKGSNLLHRVQENGKVDIQIVDFQTIRGGSPIIDLLYFIFSSSDEQFREQYYDKLIDHYYTQLSAAMRRLHLNPDEIFSRKDFDQELKEKLPLGLMLAVFALPVLTVDEENAPAVNEDLAFANFVVNKTSDLYTERINGVVNDYVKFGILK